MKLESVTDRLTDRSLLISELLSQLKIMEPKRISLDMEILLSLISVCLKKRNSAMFGFLFGVGYESNL